jgi:hypothetical protein
MAYLHSKNPKFGLFWKALKCEFLLYINSFGVVNGHLISIMGIWFVLWLFGIFYDYLVFLWLFSR